MKGSERHHLKDNELVNLALRLRRAMDARRRGLAGLAIVAAVVVAAVLAYLGWQRRVERRAEALMAAAMTVEEALVGPPQGAGAAAGGTSFATERERDEAAVAKFKAAADEYPSTGAGLLARYREAATWMALGKPKEAAAAYQQVVDHAGGGLLGQMARLGLAEAYAHAGEYDRAVSAYQEAASRADGAVPVEGILIQLGRAYRTAGKTEDAKQTFNRVVEEFPSSPLSVEARRELDLLEES